MADRVIVDELEFDVPYGKLCAKTWHEETEDCRRVLALHGWMDNAGSFDYIAPLMKDKQDLYIVAIDLPGHGKSSQLPPGASYYDLHIVMEIRRVLIEMNWIQSKISTEDNDIDNVRKKFTIIGHSLGAGMGLFYCNLFPGEVDTIILIDFVVGPTLSLENLCEQTGNAIDRFIQTAKPSTPLNSPKTNRNSLGKGPDKGNVVVSQETAIVVTIEAHSQLGKLSRENASSLLKRSTVPVSHPPNSVIYSRDLRLQAMLNFRDYLDVQKAMFSAKGCYGISILGKEGFYLSKEKFSEKSMDTVIDILKNNWKFYQVKWLDGDHYLHMNNYKEVVETINDFLQSLPRA